MEAVKPAEVNLYNARVSGFTPTKNDELMVKQLNLLEEYQESVSIRLADINRNLPGGTTGM